MRLVLAARVVRVGIPAPPTHTRHARDARLDPRGCSGRASTHAAADAPDAADATAAVQRVASLSAHLNRRVSLDANATPISPSHLFELDMALLGQRGRSIMLNDAVRVDVAASLHTSVHLSLRSCARRRRYQCRPREAARPPRHHRARLRALARDDARARAHARRGYRHDVVTVSGGGDLSSGG